MSSTPSSKVEEELKFKNITVLLADPTLDESYYEYWIPQDDIDLQEWKDNLQAMEKGLKVTYYDNHRALMKEWLENPPEFVWNSCDDGFMNKEEQELHLTAFMDMLGIPYTGPGAESLVLVKDKNVVRGIASSIGIPVPIEVFIDEGVDIESSVPEDFPWPAFAKLGNASGSTGILGPSVSHSREEAIKALKALRAAHPTRPLLLQEFLNGREFSVAMAGNPECGDFEVFPPVEVDYSALDPKYARVQLEEFKRDGESEFWQQVKEIRAELTEEQRTKLFEQCKKMFLRTRCKDFARMDWRMDRKGEPKLMDVNPNCWLGGKFRQMAGWGGYSWSQILRKIAISAQKRYAIKAEKDRKLLEEAARKGQINRDAAKAKEAESKK